MRAPAACAWILLDFVPSRFLADDTHQKLVSSVPACACGCPPGDARRPKKRRHRTPVPASFLALRSSCHEPSNTHAGAKPDQAGLQAPTRTCRPRHMKIIKLRHAGVFSDNRCGEQRPTPYQVASRRVRAPSPGECRHLRWPGLLGCPSLRWTDEAIGIVWGRVSRTPRVLRHVALHFSYCHYFSWLLLSSGPGLRRGDADPGVFENR
jgi:hypothetical protein